MASFGRKSGSQDAGWGIIEPNTSRASIMGSPSADGWLYQLGARVGYYTGSSASMTLGLYATSGGSTITSRLALTAAFSVTTKMADRASGADYVRRVTAATQVYKAYTYAIALGMAGSNRGAFGQDMSGHPMHDDGGVIPATYTADRVAPEGKMSLWADFQPNTRPNQPTSLSPTNGSIIVTSTPTLGASFTDPDETLPGFAIGQADRMKSYRFQVLNSAKTSVLRDSGVVTASAAQQSARRATWTVPTALGAGTYVARCTTYDMFGQPSVAADWTFTINAGGAVSAEVNPAHVVGTQANRPLTNRNGASTSQLQLYAYWNHSNGLNATNMAVRLKNSAGTVVRAQRSLSMTLASGAYTGFTIGYPSGFIVDWAELARGQDYSVEVQMTDSAGLSSSWATTGLFRVNAIPGTPSSLLPAANAVRASRPELSAVITDANDAATALDVVFRVRPAGSTGNGVAIPADRTTYSGGRWRATPTATEVPDYGIFEWQVQATDPWGLTGTASAWQRFTFALPPQITVSAPTGTLTTGTPTIEFTADKSLTAFTVDIRETSTGLLAHASGEVPASGPGGAYTVPAGELRNLTAYTVTVTGTDGVGLSGSGTSAFDIDYPAPAAVASVAVTRTPGPFEYAGQPEEWSRLAVTWAEAPSSEVTDEDFLGYLVRRIDEGTGSSLVVAHLLTRGETLFIDKTVASGTSYRYEVSYLKVINQIDIVESGPTGASGSVTLAHTTLTSMDDDDLGCPLRFWDGRDVDWITDVEIVESWGAEPIGFQGPANSLEIDGDFAVLDADDGTFTALELVREVREMATPRRTGERTVAPRIVCYRDPRGRCFLAMIRTGSESDEHTAAIGRMDLTITQVAAEQGVAGW